MKDGVEYVVTQDFWEQYVKLGKGITSSLKDRKDYSFKSIGGCFSFQDYKFGNFKDSKFIPIDIILPPKITIYVPVDLSLKIALATSANPALAIAIFAFQNGKIERRK